MKFHRTFWEHGDVMTSCKYEYRMLDMMDNNDINQHNYRTERTESTENTESTESTESTRLATHALWSGQLFLK